MEELLLFLLLEAGAVVVGVDMLIKKAFPTGCELVIALYIDALPGLSRRDREGGGYGLFT